MTAKELQQRNEKADNLRVLQTDDGQYFVESGEGKILYNVTISDDGDTCTCADFSRGIKKSSDFKCKHILAVFNSVPRKDIEGAAFLEKQVPKLDKKFITNIKGKDFVLYAGVLDLATQRNLMKLEVELIQFPNKENGHEAICRAVAVGKNGEVFSDIGDANPNNCASMIAKHLIRMSSTRAKARCLRDMCNVSMVAIEELAEIDDVINNGGTYAAPKTQPKTTKKTATKTTKKTRTTAAKKAPAKKAVEPPVEKTGKGKPAQKVDPKNSAAPSMSEAQKRAIYNLSRRRGISVEQMEQMVTDAYGCDLGNLTSTDASSFIRQLQQAA